MEVETVVLSWIDVNSGIHPMGGREFLFQRREIGHIHWNGDLDILFGKKLTTELLKLNRVQRHRFVPTVAVTLPLRNRAQISFAISLLRLSYLRALTQAANNDCMINTFIEIESEKLPAELKQLL